MDITEIITQIAGAALVGVPALAIIWVLFELLKRVVKPELYWVLAVGCGLVVTGLIELIGVFPQLTPVARWLVFGLLFGYAVSGGVSLFKRAQGFTTAPPGTVPVPPGTVVTKEGETRAMGSELRVTIGGNEKTAYTVKDGT